MTRGVHPIETESYRRLRAAVDLSALPPLSRAVAERVIHASADVGYASDLVLDEAALRAGLAALRAGASVVADTRMVAAGITGLAVRCGLDDRASPVERETPSAAGIRRAAASVGPGAGYVIGLDDAAGEARDTRSAAGIRRAAASVGPGAGYVIGLDDAAGEARDTRSAAGIRRAAASVGPGAVYVIGCAPTALVALLSLDASPALVIGLPVGFVGAVEAKRALRGSGLPACTNRGPKGGAAVAAAALNALRYWEGR